MGLRHGLWMGAACLLVLAVGAWLAVRFGDPSPSPTGSSELLDAERPPGTAEAPPVARLDPPRPPPRKATPPPVNPPPREEAPPPPMPVGEPVRPAPPPESVPSDPFEPQDGQEPPIRTLVSVGDIQLGVVRNSRIRDEAGLKRVLVRIGDDLEKRIREQQKQDVSPQQVLDGYREELGQYMDGEVELRGPGWMIGVEVGPPLPREKWWVPRRQ